MILFTVVTAIIFFIAARTRINLTTYRSFLNQIKVLIALVVVIATNIFSNWGFFKQYEQPPNTAYYLANGILSVSEYCLVFSIVVLVASGIDRIIQDRKKGAR
jgi:hypothetical protein